MKRSRLGELGETHAWKFDSVTVGLLKAPEQAAATILDLNKKIRQTPYRVG